MSQKRKHFMSLSISSFAAPLLSFSIVILLTRQMDPEIYGDYVYVIGFYAFLFQLIALGFPPTIRLYAGKSNNVIEKTRVVSGTVLLILLGGLLFTLVSLIVSMAFYYYDTSIPYELIVAILPFSITYIMKSMLDNLLQGMGYLTTLSISRVAPLLFFLILICIGIFFKPNVSTYLVLKHVSSLMILVFVFYYLKEFISIDEMKQGLMDTLRINKEFGFHVYAGSVLLLSGILAGPIVIGFFTLDKSQIAYYALALGLTSPLALLPQLFSTLYFKEFIKLKKIPFKLFSTVTLVSLLLGIIIFYFADIIVDLVYGLEFNGAVWPLKILVFASLISGINLFLDRFFHAKGLGKLIRNSSLISGIVLILSYLLFVPNYLALGASVAILVSATTNLFYKYYKYRIYIKD